MIGHLFSDSMSLVTHEAPPWLVLSGEILQIWPTNLTYQIAGSSSLQSLLPWRCSSLQQELRCFCLQCSWNLVWNNWIGHMLEVIIMQLTWTFLIAAEVFPRRNTKISMAFEVEDCFLSFFIEKIRSSQVKLNFDVQLQESSITKKASIQ